jgi:hypothetical protein
MVLFYRNLPRAVFVVARPSALAYVVLKILPLYVPSMNPAEVFPVGATQLKYILSAVDIVGIKHAHMNG